MVLLIIAFRTCYFLNSSVSSSKSADTKAESIGTESVFTIATEQENGRLRKMSGAAVLLPTDQYLIAATQGDAQSQYELGVIYDEGKRVPEDDLTAVKWYRRSADQGYAAAQYNLGVMYANGFGVTADDVIAVEWYLASAEQGNANAQSNLGIMYSSGRGVPTDNAAAVNWYQLAADQGNARGQYNLGVMHERGAGVIEDDVQAANFYRRASKQGHAKSQYNLAVMYAKGEGVQESLIHAYLWTSFSAAQGDEFAVKLKSLLIEIMTPAELSSARLLALKCFQTAYEQCE